MYNAAGAGFMLRVGKFKNYFDAGSIPKEAERKNTQLYVFMRGRVVRVVLSNALLQGGLINQISQNAKGYTLV